MIRAGVHAMASQNRDNVDALAAAGMPIPELKLDGGAANALLCRFRAVEVPFVAGRGRRRRS